MISTKMVIYDDLAEAKKYQYNSATLATQYFTRGRFEVPAEFFSSEFGLNFGHFAWVGVHTMIPVFNVDDLISCLLRRYRPWTRRFMEVKNDYLH